MTFTMFIGPKYSGKKEYVENFKDDENTAIIKVPDCGPDSIYGGAASFNRCADIADAINLKRNVVYCGQNLNKTIRMQIVDHLRKASPDICICAVVFDKSRDDLLKAAKENGEDMEEYRASLELFEKDFPKYENEDFDNISIVEDEGKERNHE